MSFAASRRVGEDRSLEYYYREVEKHPQLTPGEEESLAIRIENGDEKAVEELVNANLRFVIHVARGYQNQGLSLADLINEGNMGLITAARKFNRHRGCKFITYAVWWIRQNILKALEVQTRTIRIPANVLNDFSRLRKAEIGLAQRLRRDPSLDEIAGETKYRSRKVADTFEAVHNTVSLDSPPREADTTSPLDAIPDTRTPHADEAFLRQSLSRELSAALNTLSGRHRQILDLYFGMDGGEPATYQQIGTRLGVSRERVRQLKEDALNKLRQPALCRRLADYCD